MDSDYIHTIRCLEIIKERGFISYPQGTPPLSINMKGYKAFHIYKYVIINSGLEYPPIDIGRWIGFFQRQWRKLRWIRRRGLQWIRMRELGAVRSSPRSYILEPRVSPDAFSVAQ